MIVFWFIVFYAWHGLRGGASQTASDARTGLRTARGKARARTAKRFRTWDRSVRAKPRTSPVRVAWGTARAGYKAGAYGAAGTRAAGRGVRTAGRSWRTGWQAGTARGKERHAAYVKARTAKNQATTQGGWDAEPFPRAPIPTGPVRTDPTVQPVPADRTDETPGDAHEGGTPQHPDREQVATVTPIREDNEMSAPAGEVTGLDAAVHLYDEWINQLGDGPAELEALAAGMSSHGLSGDAVTAPTQASEHLDAARSAMESGKAALEQHLAAAEQLRALGGDEAEKTSFYTAS